jgi:high-affinity iron transporter
MLATLLVTLREGIEAFLIVAITLAYLRKTHRVALGSAVLWGTGAGVAVSVLAGYFFGQAENKPLWEGLLALAAAVMVLSMVFYMLKASKRMRGDIAAKVEAAALKSGTGAWLGVFAFVLVMIVREGMETALILTTLLFEQGSRDLLVGATFGVLLAALVAWAWSRYGQRVNLKRFFQGDVGIPDPVHRAAFHLRVPRVQRSRPHPGHRQRLLARGDRALWPGGSVW